jgi:TetR/AcrR family transcriptional regulator, tetracycline repressor protein
MAEDLDLPDPPWLSPARRRSTPRPQLNREGIVDAALTVLRRHGSEGLTMRRVADELGAGAASLYGYVNNKEELIQLILDRIIGEMKVPEADPDVWQDQLKQFMRQGREVFQRYPGTAGLTLGRIPLGPHFLLHSEALLSLLRAGGLPDQICAYAGDLIGLYLGAIGYEENMGLAFPTDAPFEEQVAMMRDYLASLPMDRFPNTVALARAMTTGTFDERFEWGMDVLVRGLASYGPPGTRRRHRASAD